MTNDSNNSLMMHYKFMKYLLYHELTRYKKKFN